MLKVLIIIIAGLAFAYYATVQFQETFGDDPAVACPADAKQCPDGSYVGRSGNRCEFVCPK